MTPLIECRRISCRYGAVNALAEFSLAVEQGAWVTVLGPSGSGKTTLLRALAGLEPLTDGEIVLGGALASNHRIRLAPHQRGIGLLFQEPSLWPHLDAAANVELALSGTLPRRQQRTEALDWLGRVGAAPLASRRPGELSGGEARRVTLARALAARPAILLLDEPTTHLDLHLREELMGLVRRMHAELGLTTLCVTHQLEPPIAAHERMVILECGRMIFDGSFSDLPQAPATDYTQALRRWIGRLEHWA
jgi:ABC-type Fe3+/spermidine/putrescine transport system ATPase subunit